MKSKEEIIELSDGIIHEMKNPYTSRIDVIIGFGAIKRFTFFETKMIALDGFASRAQLDLILNRYEEGIELMTDRMIRVELDPKSQVSEMLIKSLGLSDFMWTPQGDCIVRDSSPEGIHTITLYFAGKKYYEISKKERMLAISIPKAKNITSYYFFKRIINRSRGITCNSGKEYVHHGKVYPSKAIYQCKLMLKAMMFSVIAMSMFLGIVKAIEVIFML